MKPFFGVPFLLSKLNCELIVHQNQLEVELRTLLTDLGNLFLFVIDVWADTPDVRGALDDLWLSRLGLKLCSVFRLSESKLKIVRVALLGLEVLSLILGGTWPRGDLALGHVQGC